MNVCRDYPLTVSRTVNNRDERINHKLQFEHTQFELGDDILQFDGCRSMQLRDTCRRSRARSREKLSSRSILRSTDRERRRACAGEKRKARRRGTRSTLIRNHRCNAANSDTAR